MALVPVYLPMAETAIDGLLLVGIGSGVGLLSGLFGVGGGFLITPLLIFLGVPPAVAAATGANTVIASSASGALAHWQRGTLDVKMGLLLLAGGLAGSAASVRLFGILAAMGQIDLVVSLSYVLLLGGVGAMMFAESVRGFLPGARKAAPAVPRAPFGANMPWKTAFPRSGVETSALSPVILGFIVGVMTGLMGVGGGFLLVPAMIYLLGMPTTTVVGTSLFQILFVSANVTFLQAWSHHTVDVVLAALLVAGGVVAAPYGAKLGARLGAARLRVLLALLVLTVAIGLGVGLVRQPADLYSIRIDVSQSGDKDQTP
ncbi:MAG: sulfite exporter TauE/SafE family protein [Rhodospirillales bacterium]|nr:sulfite exporter TauE/SafE family protein [Rhodospirillales bacterium]